MEAELLRMEVMELLNAPIVIGVAAVVTWEERQNSICYRRRIVSITSIIGVKNIRQTCREIIATIRHGNSEAMRTTCRTTRDLAASGGTLPGRRCQAENRIDTGFVIAPHKWIVVRGPFRSITYTSLRHCACLKENRGGIS